MDARLEDLVRLRRVRDTMDRRSAEPWTVAQLARLALMSESRFQREFRAAFGETPHQRLMLRRIERASALLRDSDLTVTEICMAVGCASLGSFSARFTELVGVPPSVYRTLDHDDLRALPDCEARRLGKPSRGAQPSRIREAVGASAS